MTHFVSRDAKLEISLGLFITVSDKMKKGDSYGLVCSPNINSQVVLSFGARKKLVKPHFIRGMFLDHQIFQQGYKYFLGF